MRCVKDTLNLKLLQEKRQIKKRRENCFQTLYTAPSWSTHPIIFERLTVMVMQCLPLPNFEVVIRLGISELMRSSEIIESEAMRG
jgi:hypothetical protein